MRFEIRLHEADRIIEVVYPEKPSAEDVAEYAGRLRPMIDSLHLLGWRCLVDQRHLKVLSPELLDKIAELNAYAEKHGMKKTARLISSAVADLQTARMARTASLHVPIRTFISVKAAMQWLREEEQARP